MKKSRMKAVLLANVGLLLLASASQSEAGLFILSGTDSDDHGSANATDNFDGWLFMEKAIENIALTPGGVTNGNKTVVALASSSTALTAAQSAFDLSSLPDLGWTFSSVDGDAAVTTFFSTGINSAGIILMDSADNISGGASASELAIFSANATTIDSFLGAGGGLFSQGNDFGWVSALLPALAVVDLGSGGIGDALTLTAQGTAAFPGLTSADLSTGPYHNVFTNPAGLQIFAVNTDQEAVVIGGLVSPTQPNAIPEPGTAAAGLLAGLVGMVRRRRQQ
jgi:hypothetical protein